MGFAQLLANFFLIFVVERLQLVALACVKKLPCHAWLSNGNAHSALKLATGNAGRHFGVSRDNNLLFPVVFCLTFTEVLSLLGRSVLVAMIEVLDDSSVQVLDLLLQWRQALNSVNEY